MAPPQSSKREHYEGPLTPQEVTYKEALDALKAKRVPSNLPAPPSIITNKREIVKNPITERAKSFLPPTSNYFTGNQSVGGESRTEAGKQSSKKEVSSWTKNSRVVKPKAKEKPSKPPPSGRKPRAAKQIARAKIGEQYAARSLTATGNKHREPDSQYTPLAARDPGTLESQFQQPALPGSSSLVPQNPATFNPAGSQAYPYYQNQPQANSWSQSHDNRMVSSSFANQLPGPSLPAGLYQPADSNQTSGPSQLFGSDQPANLYQPENSHQPLGFCRPSDIYQPPDSPPLAQPHQPAAPYQPVYSYQPAAPYQSVYPYQPAAPYQSVYSHQPAAPYQSTYPHQAAASHQPAASFQPADLHQPVASYQSAASYQIAGSNQPPNSYQSSEFGHPATYHQQETFDQPISADSTSGFLQPSAPYQSEDSYSSVDYYQQGSPSLSASFGQHGAPSRQASPYFQTSQPSTIPSPFSTEETSAPHNEVNPLNNTFADDFVFSGDTGSFDDPYIANFDGSGSPSPILEAKHSLAAYLQRSVARLAAVLHKFSTSTTMSQHHSPYGPGPVDDQPGMFMGTRRRFRAHEFRQALHQPLVQAARGLSPDRSAVGSPYNRLESGLDAYLSDPTVPEINDFRRRSMSRGRSRRQASPTTLDPGKLQSGPANRTPTSPINVYNNPTADNLGLSFTHPSNPKNSFNMKNDGFTEANIAKNESGFNSVQSCTGDCSEKGCLSCNGSNWCYAPCLNPTECSSGNCTDVSCCNTPQPECTKHHTPEARQPVGFTLPETLQDQQKAPTEAAIDCRWLLDDKECNISLPTVDQMDQHIVQDHIQPQSQLKCEWNDCNAPMDVHQMPEHLWHVHNPESYVCLWQNCAAQSFSTHQELDDHIKSAHCRMDCHWGGCDVATTNMSALKDHFDQEHLYKNQDKTQDSLTTDMFLEPAPSAAISRKLGPSTFDPATRAQLMPQEPEVIVDKVFESETAGWKPCRWVGADSMVCQKIFPDGVQLQEHLYFHHLFYIKSTPLICQWKDCPQKEEKKIFKDKSKLSRHLWIHSKCTRRACGDRAILEFRLTFTQTPLDLANTAKRNFQSRNYSRNMSKPIRECARGSALIVEARSPASQQWVGGLRSSILKLS